MQPYHHAAAKKPYTQHFITSSCPPSISSLSAASALPPIFGSKNFLRNSTGQTQRLRASLNLAIRGAEVGGGVGRKRLMTSEVTTEDDDAFCSCLNLLHGNHYALYLKAKLWLPQPQNYLCALYGLLITIGSSCPTGLLS